MRTLERAHAGPDAAYYGERGEWLVAYVITRDSETLDRANFDEMVSLVDRDDVEGNWAVERSRHWAVGWVDFLVVRPGSEAAEIAQRALDQLQDYPVLDDERLSEYEDKERADIWAELPMRERIRVLANHGDSIFAARTKYAEDLYQRAENTYYSLNQ